MQRMLAISPVVNYSALIDPLWKNPPKVLFMGENITNLIGYDKNYLVDDLRRWFDLVHPEDLPKVLIAANPEALKTGNFERIYRIRHEQGHYLWIQENMRIVPHPESGGVNIIGAMMDYSGRKAIEDKLRATEDTYRFLVEQSIVAVYMVQDGRFKYVNPRMAEIFGYSREEMLAAPSMLDFIYQEDHTLILENFRRRLEGEVRDMHYPFRIRHKDGHIVDVEAHGSITHIGGKPAIIGMGIEITERKAAEDRLREMEEKYRCMVEQSVVGVYMVQDGRFVYANAKLAEFFGCSQEEIVAAPSIFDFFHPEDHEVIKTNINRRLSGETQSLRYTLRVRRKDNRNVILDVHGTIARIGSAPLIIGMGIDITELQTAELELKRHRDNLQEMVNEQTINLLGAKESAEKAMHEAMAAEERARYLARNDALTGLPNRILLLDRLEQAIAHAQRYGNKVGLLFIDLDRFKNINDSLGHAIGDKLLQAAATRLVSCVRYTDTISRLGGDEFVILLTDIHLGETVIEVAEKLLGAVALPYEIDGHELTTTISIGISIYPEHGGDMESLMKRADSAMYKAKAAGRNNYQMFTDDIDMVLSNRLSLENDMRRALEREEFILHYQPQIDLNSGKIIATEALVRWQHPIRGLLGPDQFIGIAEESGLILPLGKWVLREACRQNGAWQAAGLPAITVAVNLSALQLNRGNFLRDVTEILDETQMPPHWLLLELTESMVMQGGETILSTFKALKEMGVQLSIDDFGTGYSSLSYLKRFPIDSLKIDRSFIRDISTDPDDAAIVRAIISMGHSLRLSVVAEGVETDGQLAFLRQQHCDAVQGHYFSLPLPADELAFFLKNEENSVQFKQKVKFSGY